ncbi:MAG: serine/threonine protein kinase, partial [Myxococcales bacterium]|nr:serine/threonine protein kinase [Myxococcales bacterium]
MLTPTSGEVIAGRYRLEREIARGGMGSVWAGVDDKLRRAVAVKLVAPDWDDAADAHQRFEREAMAVARLQSPHVVQVFDYGVERGVPYIVMELLEGEDLRARLHKVKRVSLETAAHILVQTAKALSVAHAAGVVHRDLKPGNIFLVRAGEEEIVKVLDFGVAQTNAHDLLEQRADEPIMGTPQFMSPEHARGLPVDHRSDLWSLAVIIYKALTGRLPFHGDSPTSVIVKVCTLDPESVLSLAPDLPRELEGFFKRALAREREARFGSAREMALAFSRISPVTFTTLSMPDPAQIEAAIRRAKQGAADDDELATVSFDALTQAVDDDMLERLKTSTLNPAKLQLLNTAASSPRGPAGALPLPSPPPRRSSRGVLVAHAPIEASDVEVLDLDAVELLDETEPPTQAVSSSHALQLVALVEDDEVEEAVVSTPFALGAAMVSEPAVLPSASLPSTSLPPNGGAPQVVESPEPPPSSKSRPSIPTLRGVAERDSVPAPREEKEGARPTLVLALAAVAVGVVVALIGNAVVSSNSAAPAAAMDVPIPQTAPQDDAPRDSGDGTAVDAHAEPEVDEAPAAPADEAADDTEDAERPVEPTPKRPTRR